MAIIPQHPDTPAQPKLSIRHWLGGTYAVLLDGKAVGSVSESAAGAPISWWAEPIKRSFPTLEAAATAIERDAVRRGSEAAA